jgi:hypothetical protein
VVELRRRNLEALDGAQDRDCGRNRAVSVEQGRADQADDDHRGAPAVPLGAAWADQRQERQDAALAVIVCAHDEDRVFERNDEDERPEDQRHDAEHRFRRDLSGGTGGFGRDVKRIERARADIAKNDAHASKRRRPQRPPRFLRVRRSRRCADLRDCAHRPASRPAPCTRTVAQAEGRVNRQREETDRSALAALALGLCRVDHCST